MYKTFNALLTIFWLLDIFNFPFMEMFDAVYPINTALWILIWILIPSAETVMNK